MGWALVGLGVVERILDWAGNFDLVLARTADPGWIGAGLKILAANSGIIGTAAIVVGFILVLKAERSRSDAKYATKDAIPEGFADFVDRRIQDKLNSGEVILDGGTFDEEPAPQSALYCYSPSLSLGRMDSDNRIEIGVIAFNGYSFTGSCRNVSGNVTARGKNITGTESVVKLLTPSIIPDRSPVQFMARSEFMIVLAQSVTNAERGLIMDMLKNGLVTFDFRELDITIDVDADPVRSEKLALTRSPNARLSADGTFSYNHTIFATVDSVISSSDSTSV